MLEVEDFDAAKPAGGDIQVHNNFYLDPSLNLNLKLNFN
jgi:hypothetical protein